VLEIHGTGDTVVPYEGSGSKGGSGAVWPYVQDWVQRDRCDGARFQRQLDSRTTRYDWLGCEEGARVAHIKIQGEPHGWPGANPDRSPARGVAATSVTVWRFFARLGRRPPGSPAAR
jgi:polyhydroxybutyrate depolymerase